MGQGSPLTLGIGIVLLAAGGLTLTRALRAGPDSPRATYGGRILGMMLLAGGLALTVFTLALGHYS